MASNSWLTIPLKDNKLLFDTPADVRFDEAFKILGIHPDNIECYWACLEREYRLLQEKNSTLIGFDYGLKKIGVSIGNTVSGVSFS